MLKTGADHNGGDRNNRVLLGNDDVYKTIPDACLNKVGLFPPGVPLFENTTEIGEQRTTFSANDSDLEEGKELSDADATSSQQRTPCCTTNTATAPGQRRQHDQHQQRLVPASQQGDIRAKASLVTGSIVTSIQTGKSNDTATAPH